MKDSLTASVARLHRAGSEYSEQTKKSREAADRVILWLVKNWPFGLKLPCDCAVYPSGEFVYKNISWWKLPRRIKIWVFEFLTWSYFPLASFTLVCEKEHSIDDLNSFSKLIASGFLDKIAEILEDQAQKQLDMTNQINQFFDISTGGEGG